MPAGSSDTINEFINLSDSDQREYLEDRAKAETLFRLLFSILDRFMSQPSLVKWALCMINGILEDRRTRVKRIIAIQKSLNASKKMDCIGTLLNFISTRSKDQFRDERDLAAHTLAIIIEAYDMKNCSEHAYAFLTLLMEHKDDPKFLAPEVYSHCLMYLMKINQLAVQFIERRGFHILQKMLATECTTNATIAYNVCCTLWVLSYLPQATVYFGDFRLNIIEHVSKILDYFNKEKIVRIICMLFDVRISYFPLQFPLFVYIGSLSNF